MKEFLRNRWEGMQAYLGGGMLPKILAAALALYLGVALLLGWYWSREPDMFSVRDVAERMALEKQQPLVTGYATTATLITLAETLLNKPGGYISNDILPPGVWLDNISNWEFGVLVQIRDMARSLRNDISRSQSQSAEDRHLRIAEPQFHFDSQSWALPATEREYRRGIEALNQYLQRLADSNQPDARFYARADNLRNWLANLETRLGSLSNRLSESVGKQQLDQFSAVAAGGAYAATGTGGTAASQVVKTPWLEIDDNFYEARGTAWALVHLLKAIEIDFHDVLVNKGAMPSLQQIIIELEAAQAPIWSPVVLNGSGFGFLANHSLTMASYISRANAAIRDLRSLLAQG